MIVIGVDPGITGAITFIGAGRALVYDLPTVELPGNGLVRQRVYGPDLAQLIRRHWPADQAAVAYLEDVATMGGQNNAVQTQGSLMRTRGTIETVLELLRITVEPVRAQTWKNFYGLLGKDASQAKKLALEKARGLYPALATTDLKLAKHHNRAESLLIAHYGVQEQRK